MASILDHLNQDFPPRLPDGWDHRMPFHIQRVVNGRTAKVVACVKRIDLPPHYLVEVESWNGRVHIDADGTQHVGKPMFKHTNPPMVAEFEEAVRVAEAYLDGTLRLGAVVEDPTK